MLGMLGIIIRHRLGRRHDYTIALRVLTTMANDDYLDAPPAPHRFAHFGPHRRAARR
jgi:hypothetical protein